MKKGITPIIAIIVLLLITIALAGATWTYLSAYWFGMIGKNVQVMESYCTKGDTGIILLRNTGTSEIHVSSITVLNTTNDMAPKDGQFKTLGGAPASLVAPNKVVKYEMTCKGMCTVRIMLGGRSLVAAVLC